MVLLYNFLLSIRHKLIYTLRGQPRLHCIGDSHVAVFDYIRLYHPNRPKGYRIYTCRVPGATNMGLDNPNSKTKALPIFQDYIKNNVKKKDYVLFLLGEVDCGFVIWYRSKKHGRSVREQFDKSIGNYRALMDFAADHVDDKVLICETPYPTIRDGEDMGEVANKRKDIDTGIRERTDLTIKYNEALHHYCQNKGYTFIGMKEELLDDVTGLVKDEVRNEDPTDHHYSHRAYSTLLLKKLNELE